MSETTETTRIDFIPGRVYMRTNSDKSTDYAIAGPKKIASDGSWACWLHVFGNKQFTVRSNRSKITVEDDVIAGWELAPQSEQETATASMIEALADSIRSLSDSVSELQLLNHGNEQHIGLIEARLAAIDAKSTPSSKITSATPPPGRR